MKKISYIKTNCTFSFTFFISLFTFPLLLLSMETLFLSLTLNLHQLVDLSVTQTSIQSSRMQKGGRAVAELGRRRNKYKYGKASRIIIPAEFRNSLANLQNKTSASASETLTTAESKIQNTTSTQKTISWLIYCKENSTRVLLSTYNTGRRQYDTNRGICIRHFFRDFQQSS